MSATVKRSVTITLDGSNKSTSLPLLSGSIGPDVFDIRKLYGELGVFTFDPGYGATASCDSKITYIDGDEGVLLYRGYPIEQLAEKSNFLEVCYLLLNGELPTEAQAQEFDLGVMRHTMLHEQLRTFYNGFRRDAHPMAVMCGVVGALSAFYHDSLDIHSKESRDISAFRLIAKLPTIAAWAHKYSVGQPFIYPRNDLTYAENFLHMFHAVPAEEYKVNPVLSKAMDLIMILHADHEQNAGGIDGRQSVRLHRGRHRQPVGPGAWRRERGSPEDAGRDRPHPQHQNVPGRREGQRQSHQADGLWSSRVQKL